jgi:alanyl-tRNA synthetase
MAAPPAGATERLYYADSYIRVFEARVLDATPHQRGQAVVLDRTGFFPTSGGQPHDCGVLGGATVLDVIDGGAAIVHIVDRPVAGAVRGEIDWARRFDHMQQHSGQHVLSQAALRVLGAQTTAVHLGAERCTLDLDRPGLTAAEADAVEDLANAVVVDDRPVQIRFVGEAELPALGLRRMPKTTGVIRVIEVEDFDRSACGGTHVRRTGEIGVIKIRRWERLRGGVRLEFACGGRALRDYRWKHALLSGLAASLSVQDRAVADAVARLAAEARASARQAAELRERLLERDARSYLAAAGPGPQIVAAVLDRPADEAAALAGKIAASGEAVAVFAAGGRIVVACAPALGVAADALLREIVEPLGGRGGGRSQFAQGVVPLEAQEAAIALAREALRRRLA